MKFVCIRSEGRYHVGDLVEGEEEGSTVFLRVEDKCNSFREEYYIVRRSSFTPVTDSVLSDSLSVFDAL